MKLFLYFLVIALLIVSTVDFACFIARWLGGCGVEAGLAVLIIVLFAAVCAREKTRMGYSV
ncbi:MULTISPECIES: hypothetical protein [Asaia]|uniref:hypothetical protein n=1 Tax=Asaia TaxID=91914 RepID=UPI002FC286DE